MIIVNLAFFYKWQTLNCALFNLYDFFANIRTKITLFVWYFCELWLNYHVFLLWSASFILFNRVFIFSVYFLENETSTLEYTFLGVICFIFKKINRKCEDSIEKKEADQNWYTWGKEKENKRNEWGKVEDGKRHPCGMLHVKRKGRGQQEASMRKVEER